MLPRGVKLKMKNIEQENWSNGMVSHILFFFSDAFASDKKNVKAKNSYKKWEWICVWEGAHNVERATLVIVVMKWHNANNTKDNAIL